MGSCNSKINKDDNPPPRPVDQDKKPFLDTDKEKKPSVPDAEKEKETQKPTAGVEKEKKKLTEAEFMRRCPSPENFPAVGMRDSVARSSEGGHSRGGYTSYSLPRHSAFNTSSEHSAYNASDYKGSDCKGSDYVGEDYTFMPTHGHTRSRSTAYNGSEYAFMHEKPDFLGFTSRSMANSTASSVYDGSVRGKKSLIKDKPIATLLDSKQRELLHEPSSSSEAPAPPPPPRQMEPIFGRNDWFPDPNFRKAPGMKWRKPVHGLDYCGKPKKL